MNGRSILLRRGVALRNSLLPLLIQLAGVGGIGCGSHTSGPVTRTPAGSERAQIADYPRLTAALETGTVVRAVIHYGRCILKADGKEGPGPDAVGGMDLSTYESFAPMLFHNPKGFVAASETRLIAHAQYGYVYDYVKLRIYDDSRVEIVARYLDPKTFEVRMDELFTCQLGAAGGVELSQRGGGENAIVPGPS